MDEIEHRSVLFGCSLVFKEDHWDTSKSQSRFGRNGVFGMSDMRMTLTYTFSRIDSEDVGVPDLVQVYCTIEWRNASGKVISGIEIWPRWAGLSHSLSCLRKDNENKRQERMRGAVKTSVRRINYLYAVPEYVNRYSC